MPNNQSVALSPNQQSIFSKYKANLPTTPINASKIGGLIGQQGEQGARTAELNKEQDVIGKQTATRNLENEYTSKTRAYDKQIENIRKNSTGKLQNAVEADVANLERQKNSELADLA